MQKRGNASRRDMLAGSMAGGLSLSLTGLLRAEEAAGAIGAQAIRSCIFVFYYGGPSHLDTYDLKPSAPSTVRGEFNPIDTTVPGIQISEHLPQMARVMAPSSPTNCRLSGFMVSLSRGHYTSAP